MANQLKLHLIDGRFGTADSKILLSELVGAKLRHHQRRLNEHDSSEEGIKASETRIKQLEDDLRNLLLFLRTVEAEGGRVDIEGTLVVTQV